MKLKCFEGVRGVKERNVEKSRIRGSKVFIKILLSPVCRKTHPKECSFENCTKNRSFQFFSVHVNYSKDPNRRGVLNKHVGLATHSVKMNENVGPNCNVG